MEHDLAGRRVLGREAFADAMRGALASPLADAWRIALAQTTPVMA